MLLKLLNQFVIISANSWTAYRFRIRPISGRCDRIVLPKFRRILERNFVELQKRSSKAKKKLDQMWDRSYFVLVIKVFRE